MLPLQAGKGPPDAYTPYMGIGDVRSMEAMVSFQLVALSRIIGLLSVWMGALSGEGLLPAMNGLGGR